jgi:hypothetical protein
VLLLQFCRVRHQRQSEPAPLRLRGCDTQTHCNRKLANQLTAIAVDKFEESIACPAGEEMIYHRGRREGVKGA